MKFLPILILFLAVSIVSAEKQTDKVMDVISDSLVSDMQADLESWTDHKLIDILAKQPLTEEGIKKLYLEFKDTIVTLPNPETYKEYTIENTEASLEKTLQLGRKIHNMLFAVSDQDIEKYGGLLHIMRDVLYLDSKHIPLAIRHDNSRDVFWYELHNKWAKEAEDKYSELFNKN